MHFNRNNNVRRDFKSRKLSLESGERDEHLLFYFLNLMGDGKINLISGVDYSHFVFETYEAVLFWLKTNY